MHGASSVARRLVDVVDTDVLQRDLTCAPVGPPAQAPGVRVLRVDTAQGVPLSPAQRRHFRPFLRRGDTGFLALKGDDVVGWVWLSQVSHRDPWSGLRIHLAPDEGYAYDLWTDPGARRLLLGQSLMGALLRHGQTYLGLSRVYGWVDRANRSSAVLLRLLGFVDAQTVRRVHVLRRTGWMRRGSDQPAFGPLSARGRHRV